MGLKKGNPFLQGIEGALHQAPLPTRWGSAKKNFEITRKNLCK
jgi:hypothetical protein